MYLPAHFSEDDPEVLQHAINQIAAATLITSSDGEITANQVPLLFDRENNCLLGHLARGNQQLRDLDSGKPVLANFLGPQSYISPNWYGDPGLVPTWNFVTVQVRGVPEILETRDELLSVITGLTEREESALTNPWTLDKVPAVKLEKMLKVIVGFRINVTDIRGKMKLSQNRSVEDQRSAISGLRAQSLQPDIADYMDASCRVSAATK